MKESHSRRMLTLSSFILHPSSFIIMSSLKPQLSEEERLARDVFARFAAAADEFEAYAHPHAERIAALSDAVARLFHLGRADRASLRIGALAHDLGEAAMKRDYIRRAGALNTDERLDLARHPVIGEQEAARAGADRAAQLIVRWSHEWWNGGGYPDALRREQIPLAARIFRVADSYCALTDDRPFRRAGTEEEARKHLTQWAGIEFDPHVVRAFLTLHGLPELRSYTRRDAGATPPAEARGVNETRETQTARDSTVGDEDRSLGGLVPEAGTNPHTMTIDEDAAVRTSDEAGTGDAPEKS
jgi:HD-GYP domain-containing protein (c-di-GMP phosphodiesterase class II)